MAKSGIGPASLEKSNAQARQGDSDAHRAAYTPSVAHADALLRRGHPDATGGEGRFPTFRGTPKFGASRSLLVRNALSPKGLWLERIAAGRMRSARPLGRLTDGGPHLRRRDGHAAMQAQFHAQLARGHRVAAIGDGGVRFAEN